MKPYIFFFIFEVILLGCTNGRQGELDLSKSSPNILFLFTDDQTFDAIHALGNDQIITPHLDQIVHSGTTFTHAFNMGAWNGAVCAASRAMIISGRSVWNANEFRQRWIQKDSLALSQTWGRLMAAKGYDTYMTGKWHVDAPPENVFQEVSHVRPGMPKDRFNFKEIRARLEEQPDEHLAMSNYKFPVGYNRPTSPDDDSWNPADTSFGGFWEGGKHWSEVLRDDAVSYIESAKNRPNPFFMYLAFNAPHDPRQAPQEYLDMYPLEEITIPSSFQSVYPDRYAIGNGSSLRDEALAPFPRTEYAVKKHLQEYYAIITHLDAQIGLIIAALKESGKLDNTYIFLTADHGLAVGKHGLIGKQNMYDHSIRVPLVIAGPDIPADQKINTEVYLQDLMPTSLDIANIDQPDYVEFNSLLPIAKNEATKGNYDSIYCGYIDLQRMIRMDGFKLILYPKIPKVKLFDLRTDPFEKRDLSDLAEYQNQLRKLKKELYTYAERINDPMDLAPFLLD